jgi:hypothetical protein
MTNPNVIHSEDAALINRVMERVATPKKRVENTEGYAFFEGKPVAHRQTHKLTVEFILDMVPGAFHQPEDLMGWICHNPYVKAVELEE